MIWVDMICIDQNDHDEKNHQVALMSQIYNQAIQVDIYLGKLDGDDALLRDSLSFLSIQWFSCV